MDYLQYLAIWTAELTQDLKSFKPYYKWITFNTKKQLVENKISDFLF